MRVEVEKGVPANQYVSTNSFRKGDRILFRGPIVFDNDPPRFLEVHPIDFLVRASDIPTKPVPPSQTVIGSDRDKEGWIYLGLISPKSVWPSGCPKNVTNAPLPIRKGDRLTVSGDVSMHGDSKPLMHASAPVVGKLHTGEVVMVQDTNLSHAKVGGNFVWAKVTSAAPPKK